MTGKPEVLFVCVHNAGHSQMAAGYLIELAQGAVEVRSAGSMPAEQINPVAIQAMAEVGIDIAQQTPKILTTESVQASDVVVTMGCGDACPIFSGKRYEDWDGRPSRERHRHRPRCPRRDPRSGGNADSRTRPDQQVIGPNRCYLSIIRCMASG